MCGVLSFEDRLRKCYFEVLDNVSAEVERRFCQPSMEKLVNVEAILLDAMKNRPRSSADLKNILGVHGEDFQVEELAAQLQMLPHVFKEGSSMSFNTIRSELSSHSHTVKELLNQVLGLLHLISVVPASAASAERSFSALRRLKTYLRSTMTQKRMTHLLLLHVHSQYTAKIVLNDVLREFASRSAERKSVFGHGSF